MFGVDTGTAGYEYTNRNKYVLDYLLQSNADIIGLQEVSSLNPGLSKADWFDTLNGNGGLTSAGYTCVKGLDVYTGREHSSSLTSEREKTMFNPIYFKTDKYKLIANDTIWFTDAESRDEASRIDGANTDKALNYVVLEVLDENGNGTGVRFMYVNLHLIVRSTNSGNLNALDKNGNDTGHLVQELQVIYLREILDDLLAQYDLPMFIGGDFNNSATTINGWLTKSVVNDDGTINSSGKPTETVKITRANPYATNVVTGCSTITEDFKNLGDYDKAADDKWGAIDLWFSANFNGVMHAYVVDDNKVASTGKYPSDHLPTQFVVTLYTAKN